MFDEGLRRAVEGFVGLMAGVADESLDREWAWGAYDSEGVRFAFFRTYEELRELAAMIAAERLARGMVASAAQRILAQYHRAYRDLEAALLGVGAEEAEHAPAEGEWPVRQVVAHIVLADLGFYGVVKYALEGHRSGDGRPAKIPVEAWDSLLGEEEAQTEAVLSGPLAGLRSYYDVHHARVVNEFAGISDDELELSSTYWEGYELSLRFRLHRFDSHLRQHVVQIDKALVATGQAPKEGKRLLRLIYDALAEAEGETIGAWDVATTHRAEVAAAIEARTEEIRAILGMPRQ